MNKIIVSSVIAFSFLAVVAFTPVIGMVGNSSNGSFGVAFADLTDYSVSEGGWNWGFEGDAPSYTVSEGDWNWGFDSGCYDACGGDISNGGDYGCYDYCGGDDYGYGGGESYSTGGGYNMGGGSFSMPRYSTGGGYYMAPRSYSPAQPSGGGSQHQNQTQSTTVSNNVTNTNTNTNVNNNTAIAVVQIGGQMATQPNYPTTPSYPAPYCSIYQAQSSGYGYGYNRPVYLSWNSSNAQNAYLSNYGSVAVNGSQTVYPTYTTTYTLTVYGYNGQQATCQTTVQMNSYIPPVPQIPTTPYVSLTQIPYTGFDFGTFGNAMYFAAIAIVALGGAYMAVYFIPQIARATTAKRSFQHVAPKAPILLEKEAAEAKFQNFVTALNKKGTNDTMAIIQEAGSMPKIVIDRS